MSDTESTAGNVPTALEDPPIVNDLDTQRFRRQAARGMRDIGEMIAATASTFDESGATQTFERVLADLGLHDPPATFTMLNVVVGQVSGFIHRASGDDAKLTLVRCFGIIDVVCDPYRENLVGKGYMFRVNPAYWESLIGDRAGELREHLDYCARQYRAVAMEIADHIKDDGKAVLIVKALIEFILSMI